MKKCSVCGNQSFSDYKRGGYPLKVCNSCTYVFDMQPFLNLKKLYSESYYKNQNIKGGYFNYFEESIVNKLTFKYRLKKIEQFIPTKRGRLLDVGCALGDFLEVAKQLRWEDSCGIDVSDYALEQARAKGLKVYKIGTGSPKLKKSSFDVITLQDVVEHYIDPRAEMELVYKLLKPGGLLFLTTPNVSSLTAKFLERNWYHYKRNEHLSYFSPKTIRLFLEKIGFREIIVRPTPSWVSVRYLLQRIHYYFPKISIQSIDRLTSMAIFQIAFPMYVGEMEIWAKKPKGEAYG